MKDRGSRRSLCAPGSPVVASGCVLDSYLTAEMIRRVMPRFQCWQAAHRRLPGWVVLPQSLQVAIGEESDGDVVFHRHK